MDISCPVCNSTVDASRAVCPACGFQLAGSTQKFKPIDDSGTIPVVGADALRSSLRILRGPQKGTEYILDVEKASIGRNPKCNIFLNDMTVSRKHAVLHAERGTYRIRDLNSFNGLWVNEKPVDEALLQSGDSVQIGVFRLVYEQE